MRKSDIAVLLALGALWGASFLFMRMGAGAFGGMALAGLRAIGAALCSIPLLASRRRLAQLRAHWRPLAVVGLANSALPFVLFSYAAQSLPAGVSAISDAIAPLLVAASGWLWLGERLDAARIVGLVVGLAGVVWLVAGTLGLGHAGPASGWAMAACGGANVCYAFGAHYSQRRLRDVAPLVVATGSQLAAATMLLPLTVWRWPARTPALPAWLAAFGLAAACTTLAYVLFYRLLARVGATRSMAVLYLIPVFGVLWGLVFLHEPVTLAMAGGCAVILLGVALTTGLLHPRLPVAAAEEA
ncbi:DMT family transporter [Fulvimonas soli]|jgi:drug/metabolite transporter (DMT)-like permease|uniref:Threonine/homoserine efflux transporter RhtA n=1 Tax=Fulvimonas soli TaxID=155197 RepID=A0A316I2T0_9GAMM|nr:DMT family transporter [Fulvimonas soli]PWK86666.1 threonine/homoserine efflux transporter RhtA [Fulvimonas soli]TNY26317.1 EamA family transporter [Fulvimonas soli]